MSHTLSRRHLLATALAAAGASAAHRLVRPAQAADAVQGRLLIPGYDAWGASIDGIPVLYAPSMASAVTAAGDGPLTLVTSVNLETGAVRRAAFPVRGHGILPVSRSGTALFVGMNAPRTVVFDTNTLELIAFAQPVERDWVFGGHALALPNGAVLVAERAPIGHARPGRLSVRDPVTLEVLDALPSHGIGPHDMRLTPEGHVAVANYGSAAVVPGAGTVPAVVAPCVTVIDPANGRLMARHEVQPSAGECRHLAPAGAAIFVVMARIAAATGQGSNPAAEAGLDYLDAPPVLFGPSGPAHPLPLADGTTAREGLSIVHDAAHAQVLVSFPPLGRIAVLAADDGRCLRLLDSDHHGLAHPTGIALLPDGRHYAATGFEGGVRVMERGTHRIVTSQNRDIPFFGHSHIAIA